MATFSNLVVAIALFAAIGCGTMAGLFFAFSNFVMKALASLSPDKGISAMQAINVAILNPLFLAAFFGTGIASLAAIIFALARWQESSAFCLLAGGVLYLVGVILVTMIFNVPLNNSLAEIDPVSPASLSIWRTYVTAWTAWNHVRSIAALAATVAFIIAFYQLRRLVA
jgi:uncharacterized membrane protein